MMNAYEFQAAVTPDHKLSIPDALFGKFETHKTIRVIVLIDESADEEHAWAHRSAEQFFAGYDDSDAVYDQYRACSESSGLACKGRLQKRKR